MARISPSLIHLSASILSSLVLTGLVAPAAWANEPPAITAPVEFQRDPGQSLLFNVNTSDPDADIVTLEAANVPPGASFRLDGNGNGFFSWRPTAADEGFYQLMLIATDDGLPVMSVSAEVAITIGQPNLPPVLDPIGDQQAIVGVLLAVPLSATDPEGDPLTFSTDPDVAGARFVTGPAGATFEYTPNAADAGNLVLTFVVSDGFSTDEETIVITVGDANVPPILHAIGDRQLEVDQPAQIELMAEDPDGNALFFDALGLPDGLSLIDRGDGSGQLSGMPTSPGIHEVTVTVTDDGLPAEAAEEVFEIEVLEPPAPDPGGLVIVEARWNKGRLLVMGEGALADGAVHVRDSTTGAMLGTMIADDDGGFIGDLRPFVPPCAVELSTLIAKGIEIKAMADVTDAPADCSSSPPVRLWGALWKCHRGLFAVGLHAPPGGVVRLLDADSGELLGETSASRRGFFMFRSKLKERPEAVRLSVEADGIEWTLDAVEVRGRRNCSAKGRYHSWRSCLHHSH